MKHAKLVDISVQFAKNAIRENGLLLTTSIPWLDLKGLLDGTPIYRDFFVGPQIYRLYVKPVTKRKPIKRG